MDYFRMDMRMDMRMDGDDWTDDDREEEERRKRMLKMEIMRRGDRFGKERERPGFIYRLEKLEHAFRRGKIAKEDYVMQLEEMRRMVERRGSDRNEEFILLLDNYLAHANTFPNGKRRREDELDDKPDPNKSEEKFAELEKTRIKWHQDLEDRKWHTVYAVKNMVSNAIILGNEYNVYRIIEMTEYLREPVFLTKMAYMSVRMGSDICLQHLINYGAWVNQPSSMEDKKLTPLHLACQKNDKKCVEVLIKSRALVDKVDVAGNSSLLTAMLYGASQDIIKLLLKRTRTSFLTHHINENGENLLHRCGPYVDEVRDKKPKKRDTTAAYKFILEKIKAKGELKQLIDMKDKERGHTPLADAIANNVPEIAVLLIEAGADTNVCTPSNQTLVHLAAAQHHQESLRILLEGGASAIAKDGEGLTPLQVAMKKYSRDTFYFVASLLFAHGANPHEFIDDRQTTVFHEVCRFADHRMVDLCLRYGGSPVIENFEALRPIDMASDMFLQDKLQDEALNLRNLSCICKWKIRESMESGGSLFKAVKQLPLPSHLQDFITNDGHDKPKFQFSVEDDDDDDDDVEYMAAEEEGEKEEDMVVSKGEGAAAARY